MTAKSTKKKKAPAGTGLILVSSMDEPIALKATGRLTNTIAVSTAELSQSTNFRRDVTAKIGALDAYDVLGEDVLIATYIEPEKTAGGIYKPQRKIDESRYQGKVGLVLKLGPIAFKYDGPYEYVGRVPEVGDWIMCFASDARELAIKGVSCKLVKSQLVRMVIPEPEDIW